MTTVRTTPGVPTAPHHLRWPPADVDAATYRLGAHGATHQQAGEILDYLAETGVRRLGAYMARMSDDEVARMVDSHDPILRELRQINQPNTTFGQSGAINDGFGD